MHQPFAEIALLPICALARACVRRITSPFDDAADHTAAELATEILSSEGDK
jgi:hypothetical protein